MVRKSAGKARHPGRDEKRGPQEEGRGRYTSRYITSVFQKKDSCIGLEEEGTFEYVCVSVCVCVCVCVLLVSFSETSIKIINLLLPKFEIVEIVQNTYVSFFDHLILS